jgi:hypothetical protein
MNVKKLFLFCTLTIGTASSTFGMETPPRLPRRAHSMSILDSQRSTLITDEDSEQQEKAAPLRAYEQLGSSSKLSPTKSLISKSNAAIPSKKNRSCDGACCKALQIIAQILTQITDDRVIE